MQAGTRLGPYEIVAPIGAGGMGEVWRARDTRLGRDVAIKVLPATFANDPDRLRRFEQEARATAALNHPNILAIFDIGTHEGQPYLVEELLEGESLRVRLRGGALPVAKAVELAVQIALGLAAAHEKGIIHRDLKPENLFLTKSGHLKILDFGLAKLAHPDAEGNPASEVQTHSAATEEGHVLGTVGYMAPEQVRGLPCDHRVDVFAFGCVLYELLSGQRPFVGATAADTMSAILSKDPPPLAAPDREIPPVLQGIVSRCLEKAPEDRFQSTRDLAFNLGMLARLSGLVSGPTAPLPGMAKPPKRRWVMVVAILAAGVVLVATGALLRTILGPRSSELQSVRCTRLTFRRGYVSAARFAHDGQTVVYSATWDGAPTELFSLRLGTPESTPLGYKSADLLAVSSQGELALLRNPLSPLDPQKAAQSRGQVVTFAVAPLAGGTPKDVDEAVYTADYAPDGKTMAVVRQGPEGGIEYPLGSTPKKAVANWGGGAAGLRIARDGRSVAFFTGENLRLLGADGEIKVLTRGVGWGTGLTWSARGDEIWYSDGNQVRAVTLGGRGRVVYTHMTDLALLDLAADGRVLAAATELRSRSFFRGEGDAADRELTWLDWTLLNDLSADGRWIVFTESLLGTGRKSIVYLRETTGAPPMKLGEGNWPRLSADGRFVVAVRPDTKEVVVYPVGAGPARRIPFGEVEVWMAGLLPDGSTIWLLGAAREKDEREPARSMRRMWLTDLAGGKPRPVTPVGVFSGNPVFTPDGRHVVAPLRGKPALYPLAGGEPRPIPGLEATEGIAGFSADGRSVFVSRGSQRPIPVFRVDLGTGRREQVREITPADRSGVGFLGGVGVRMSADGRSYTYSFHQNLSELYLVEGLR